MPPEPTPASNAEQFANPVPEAIRRQSARVNDMARDAGMANVPGAPPVDAPAADPPVADPPVAEPPPVAPPVVDEWKQRYETLQGKYNAEVPSLRQQVTSLERVIAAIQQPTPTPARAAATVVEVPAEDIEAYGDDLVKGARRWARAEVQPEIDALRQKIDDLSGKYGQVEASQQQTVVMTARGAVLMGLDNDQTLGVRVAVPQADGTSHLIPTWRVTNESPAFLAWLNQVDPMSGQQRLALLRNAFDSGDASRVAAFFHAFAGEHTARQVPVTPTPQTPAPGAGGPSLESLAVPGRPAGPAPSGAPAEKRIWTQAGISAFYRDVNKGLYAPGSGREAEKLRLERDIFAAVTEGRVR